MTEIKITDVSVDERRVEYGYDYSRDLRRFFADDFVVEYDVDVSDVPESLLVVPLLANLCPLAWATGADVYVPRVDETFLYALKRVQRAFEELHPELIEGGEVYARSIEDNDHLKRGDDSAMLFSAGVDSVATYLRHRDEDPTLVSIHGFDILLDEEDQWSERTERLRRFGEERGLENRFVRMNMLTFVDVALVNAEFKRFYDDYWVTSVQHGLGLLGGCAPLAAAEGIGTLYIAATHSEGFSEPWGSHPKIDDEVEWATTTVEHDGYELTRQQKLFEIADYVRAEASDLELLTCMEEGVTGNCGRCEKCSRTEVGLLLAGLDPADHGYDFDDSSFAHIRVRLANGDWSIGADERFMWEDIQNHVDLDREYPYENAEPFFAWLRDLDVGAIERESTQPTHQRMLYAVARNTPYPVYATLYPAYSAVSDYLLR